MRLSTIIAAAIALSSAPAFAQQLTQQELSIVDTDGDGAVTKPEIGTAIDAAHGQLDADGDTYVTWQEARIWITVAQFRNADTNGDERLSKNEMLAGAMSDFDAADGNGDGRLD